MDWEQEWKNHCKNKCGFAMNCTCGGPAGFCPCAKRRWIENQKMIVGEPYDVALATSCYQCNKHMFYAFTCGKRQLELCRDCAKTYKEEE